MILWLWKTMILAAMILLYNVKLALLVLLQCSATRQVPGSQTLHPCRSSALLFKSPYNSFSINSSIIPIRFLPRPLLPSIFTSITSFICPSPLIIFPIQFFFLQTIVSTIDLFSPTLLRTSSFVIFSVQLMRSILLHIHISNASILLISSFLSDHVSALLLVNHSKIEVNIFDCIYFQG